MYLPKSEKELEVIKTLLEHPERDWGFNDLSKESGVPKTTVWRAVNRLDDRGLVDKSMTGNTSIIKVKNRRVLERIVRMVFSEVDEMREIAREYAEEVGQIAGVKSCILFGSVARGTADFESDIDILILVADERVGDRVNMIADRFNSEKSVRIMPDVLERSRFKEMKDYGEEFAEEIKREGTVLWEEDKNE